MLTDCSRDDVPFTAFRNDPRIVREISCMRDVGRKKKKKICRRKDLRSSIVPKSSFNAVICTCVCYTKKRYVHPILSCGTAVNISRSIALCKADRYTHVKMISRCGAYIYPRKNRDVSTHRSGDPRPHFGVPPTRNKIYSRAYALFNARTSSFFFSALSFRSSRP